MTNLDSVLKSRDVTLLTKVHIVKAMVFPIRSDQSLSRVLLFVTPWTAAPYMTASIHDYWINHSFDYMDLCWQSNVSAFSYAV